jgi:DNA repair exonuclease SbcCD ATPase subunit
VIFKQMSLEGFMPYRHGFSLPLENQGLVVVLGDNQVSTIADSNGSGKTSLIDAFVWALKSMTLPRPQKPHGLSGLAVACRFSKGVCRVSQEIEDADGNCYVLSRTERPSGLYLKPGTMEELGDEAIKPTGEHQTEIQAKIDALVPYGYLTICNAMVFGQESFDRWARSEQSDQMRMMDEMYGKDWRRCKKIAEQWRAKWGEIWDKASSDLAAVQSAILADESAISNLESVRASYTKQRTQAIEAAARRRNDVILAESAFKKRAVKLTAEEARLLGWRLAWSRVEKAFDAWNARQHEYDLAAAESDRLIAESKQERVDLDQLLAHGKCPTCRLTLKGKQIEMTVRAAFAPDIETKDNKATIAYRKKSQANGALGKAKSQLLVARAFLPADFTDKRLIALETLAAREREALESEQVELKDRRVIADKDLADAKAMRWGGSVPLAEAHERLRAAGARRDSLNARADKASAGKRVAQYAMDAFGDRGIRNYLFDSVKDELNDFLAAHLEVLTAGEAKASADSQRETKRGTVQNKITIHSEWSWGAGSYAGGSGGQSRRVDLGWFAALQDAAESSWGRPFPIKWYDQPDDNLDARGQEIFCEWLSQQREKRGTTVVITHNSDMLGLLQPDRVWRVILERNKGASVVIE